MKLNQIICCLLTMAGGVFMVNADNGMTMTLKNSSELNGYISSQRPGQNMTFATTSASVVVPAKDVRSIIDHEVKYADLSPQWREWAEKNDAFRGAGSSRTLLLSDIITTTGTISRVRLLERGARVRYLELVPNSYALTWKDVVSIRENKRPRLMLSGVNLRYKMNSGMEYEGQYVGELVDSTVSLLRDNGMVEVFDPYDVVRITVVPVNPNQTLLQQSPLLDIVVDKAGTNHRGVIRERNYSASGKTAEEYVLIETAGNVVQSIPMNTIVEYRKESNPDYTPLTDIELGADEAAINRQAVKLRLCKDVANVGGSDFIMVNTDSIGLTVSPANTDGILTAEFNLDNAKAQQLKLLPMSQFKDKRSKKVCSGFTYADMVKSAIAPAQVVTSVNGVSKLEYQLPAGTTGTYGIYNPETQKIVLFTVQ